MTTAERPEIINHSRGTPGTGQTGLWGSSEVPYSLSEKELDVLYQLREGLNEGQIATELRLSDSDVKKHLAVILAKTNSRSKTEAAVKAIREGIFPLPGPEYN